MQRSNTLIPPPRSATELLALLLAGLLVGGARVSAQSCEGTWTTVPTPAPGPSTHQVRSISGLGEDDLWAVGTYYDPSVRNVAALALHRSGDQWTQVSPPSLPHGYVMKAVDQLAPDDVWAIGGHGIPYAFHFDGMAWTVEELPKPGVWNSGVSVEDVLALAPDDVWAVGFYDHTLSAHLRTAVWHWDGASWSVVPSPSIPNLSGNFYPSVLLSIATAGPGALVAVGEWRIGNDWFPLAMRWMGSAWTLMSPPVSAHGDGRLRSVSARSAQDIWAVGTANDHTGLIGAGFGRAFALHFDGTSWTEIPVPQPASNGINPLSGVVAGPDGVYAVGCWSNPTQGLNTFIVRYEGPGFAIVPSTNVPGNGTGWNELHGIGDVGGELWAVGQGATAFSSPTVPLVQRLIDPCADSAVAVGTGTPGCAGPLSIGANSVPALGNGGFTVEFGGLPPSAPVIALLGTAVDAGGTLAPGFGVVLHIHFATSVFVLPINLTSGPDGGASLSLSIPANPTLVGQVFVLQGFGRWPASACSLPPSGWSSTPGLVLTIQP